MSMGPGDKAHAGTVKDSRALPIPRSVGNLLPVAWTSEHDFYMQNLIGPHTQEGGVVPIVFDGAGPTSAMPYTCIQEILELDLNQPFHPVRKIYNHINGGTSSTGNTGLHFISNQSYQTQKHVAPLLQQYLLRYKYFKVISSKYSIRIRHFGGWSGANIAPVSFFSYRINNDEMDQPFSSQTQADKIVINGDETPLAILRHSVYNPILTKQHPKIKPINGGQIIGPEFVYGFGSDDVTFLNRYPGEVHFGVVYTPENHSEDPTSTEITTMWTPTSQGEWATPSETQRLRIFCTNAANRYSEAEARQCMLFIEVACRVTVQWRDLPNDGYANKVETDIDPSP